MDPDKEDVNINYDKNSECEKYVLCLRKQRGKENRNIIFYFGKTEELKSKIDSMLADEKSSYLYDKKISSGIILFDIVDFTKRDIYDQYLCMLLVNQSLKISCFGQEADLLKTIRQYVIKSGFNSLIEGNDKFIKELHSTGDGYYIIFNKWDGKGRASYVENILKVAVCIRELILLLNVSIDDKSGLGAWDSKIDFRIFAHFGSYLELVTPQQEEVKDNNLKNIFIGDGMNDVSRMLGLDEKRKLNTLHVSESIYEKLTISRRKEYFDGTLVQDVDSKNKIHKFYKVLRRDNMFGYTMVKS